MSARPSGPLVPRRLIAAELRRLRDASGLHLDKVATETLISTSKLSRLENAQGSPTARDVRDLIRLYKVEGTQTARDLTRWVTAARQHAWWADSNDAVATRPAGFDAYVAYETEAESASVYTVPVLPALLQTEEYAHAFYRAAEQWRGDDEIDELVGLRIQRQERLASGAGTPMRLVAVTHEAGLHQRVGSAAVMQRQLEALLVASERAHIDLRVFPFTAQPTYAVVCSFALFEFAEQAQPKTLSVETHAGFRHIETPAIVAGYEGHFQRIHSSALDADASRELIAKTARGHR